METTISPAVRTKTRKRLARADHATVAATPDLFRPTRHQRDFLLAALEHPEAQFSIRQLCELSGVDPSTAYLWRRDPAFRAWWNEMLLQAARHWAGPAAFELRRLIEDAATPAAVKVRAVQAFLKAVGMGEQAHHKAHLFTELLRQFRGTTVAAEMKLAAQGEQVAMEIRAVAGTRQDGPLPAPAAPPDGGSDNAPYAEVDPIPGEVPCRHPDAVQVSFGPQQAVEAMRALRDRLTAEHQAETEQLIKRELEDMAAGRDPRNPSVARLAPPAVTRARVRPRRGEGVVEITEGGSQGQSAPPSLSAPESRPPRLLEDPP